MTHTENRRSAVRKIRGVAYALTIYRQLARLAISDGERAKQVIGVLRQNTIMLKL